LGLGDQLVDEAADGRAALQRRIQHEPHVDLRDVGRLDQDGRAIDPVAVQRQLGCQPHAQPVPHVRQQQRHAGDVDGRSGAQPRAPEELVEQAAPLAAGAEAQERLSSQQGGGRADAAVAGPRRHPAERLAAERDLVGRDGAIGADHGRVDVAGGDQAARLR